MTFMCSDSLKVDLDRYAALHAQTYGEAVDATALIPHMLEAFLAGDRGASRGEGMRPRSSQRSDCWRSCGGEEAIRFPVSFEVIDDGVTRVATPQIAPSPAPEKDVRV